MTAKNDRRDIALGAIRKAGFSDAAVAEVTNATTTDEVESWVTKYSAKVDASQLASRLLGKTIRLDLTDSEDKDLQVAGMEPETEMAEGEDETDPEEEKNANIDNRPRYPRHQPAGADRVKGKRWGLSLGSPMGAMAAEDRRYTKAAQSGQAIFVPRMGWQKAVFQDGEEARAFGAYFRCMLAKQSAKLAERHAHVADRDREVVKSVMGQKTLVSYDNELGGALIAPEFEASIIEIRSKYGACERAIGAEPMASSEKRVPRNASDFEFADISEGQTITPQDKPTTGTVLLTAKKQGGAIRLSNEMFDDTTVNLSDYIARSVRQGRDKYLDEWFIDGKNGDNGMRDLLVNTGVDFYDAALSSGWGDATVSNVEDWLGLVPTAADTIQILCSRPYFGSVLRTRGMTAGGATPGDFLGSANGQNPNADASYTGYDVFITDAMPKTYSANTIGAIAGDFAKAAKLGVRKGLAIDVDTSEGFLSDTTAVRVIQRTAKNLHNVGGTGTEGDQTLVVGWYN